MHGDYHDLVLPGGDVLVIAGDIDIWYQEHLENFCKWVISQKYSACIVVAGNHDKVLYEDGFHARNVFRKYKINYLENEGCNLGGINFYGSPISPTFGSWYFMADRGAAIQRYWNEIPQNTNILITHTPPYGILDGIPNFLTSKIENIGCFDLLKTISIINPRIHIFGHAHAGYGQKEQQGTIFINAALMNEDYQLVNSPITIDI